MSMRHQRTLKQGMTSLLVLCLLIMSTPVCELSAQNAESGSTTVESDAKTGLDVPSDSEQENKTSEEKKKDNRPRELGVMVLILWLLAGTGIGILIFTSLFGHTVRTMIRRPYPPQTHAERQKPTETSSDHTGESEHVQEKPTKS